MNKLYTTLLSLIAVSVLHAQSPGGVNTNLSMWIKADATSTLATSGSNLNSWTYANNPANVFTTISGTQPTVTPNAINFLPVVTFNGLQFMTGPSGAGAPIAAGAHEYSIFAVWNSTVGVGGANQRVWCERPNNGTAVDNNFDGAALWVYAGGATYGDQPEISPFTTGVAGPGGNVLTYAPNTVYVSQINLTANNTNDLTLVDQSNLASGGGTISTDPNGQALTNRVLNDGLNIIGARSTAGDEPFYGSLAELIVYNGPVTTAARSQIFSYLSLKYGIATKANIVNSAGTTVWDATANSAYNNFVFGLAQDNAAGLLTTQSNSLSTAGVSGAGNLVLSGPGSLTDGGYMIVGSNNAGFSEITSNLPSMASGSKRVSNQWLVQNTGSVGAVTVAFNTTGLSLTGTTASDFRLLVDNDGDGDFTTGTQNINGAASYDGTTVTFTGVNFTAAPKTVMTIISGASASTPLPVTWASFTGVLSNGNVNLNWTVGANENASYYQVQRSADGANFTTIGKVSNIADVITYGYVDESPLDGANYYRILETDLDGKSIYSKVISVTVKGAFTVNLLNNPILANKQDAEVEIAASNSGNASIEVYSLSGTRVASLMTTVSASTNRISIPLASAPAGAYIVKVQVGDVTKTLRVVKL